MTKVNDAIAATPADFWRRFIPKTFISLEKATSKRSNEDQNFSNWVKTKQGILLSPASKVNNEKMAEETAFWIYSLFLNADVSPDPRWN